MTNPYCLTVFAEGQLKQQRKRHFCTKHVNNKRVGSAVVRKNENYLADTNVISDNQDQKSTELYATVLTVCDYLLLFNFSRQDVRRVSWLPVCRNVAGRKVHCRQKSL